MVCYMRGISKFHSKPSLLQDKPYITPKIIKFYFPSLFVMIASETQLHRLQEK